MGSGQLLTSILSLLALATPLPEIKITTHTHTHTHTFTSVPTSPGIGFMDGAFKEITHFYMAVHVGADVGLAGNYSWFFLS